MATTISTTTTTTGNGRNDLNDLNDQWYVRVLPGVFFYFSVLYLFFVLAMKITSITSATVMMATITTTTNCQATQRVETAAPAGAQDVSHLEPLVLFYFVFSITLVMFILG